MSSTAWKMTSAASYSTFVGTCCVVQMSCMAGSISHGKHASPRSCKRVKTHCWSVVACSASCTVFTFTLLTCFRQRARGVQFWTALSWKWGLNCAFISRMESLSYLVTGHLLWLVNCPVGLIWSSPGNMLALQTQERVLNLSHSRSLGMVCDNACEDELC